MDCFGSGFCNNFFTINQLIDDEGGDPTPFFEMLTEDGGYMLTEDGGYMLTE